MHKFEEDYYEDYYDYEYDDKGNIIGFKEKTVPPSEHPTPVPHQPSGTTMCSAYHAHVHVHTINGVYGQVVYCIVYLIPCC